MRKSGALLEPFWDLKISKYTHVPSEYITSCTLLSLRSISLVDRTSLCFIGLRNVMDK